MRCTTDENLNISTREVLIALSVYNTILFAYRISNEKNNQSDFLRNAFLKPQNGTFPLSFDTSLWALTNWLKKERKSPAWTLGETSHPLFEHNFFWGWVDDGHGIANLQVGKCRGSAEEILNSTCRFSYGSVVWSRSQNGILTLWGSPLEAHSIFLSNEVLVDLLDVFGSWERDSYGGVGEDVARVCRIPGSSGEAVEIPFPKYAISGPSG